MIKHSALLCGAELASILQNCLEAKLVIHLGSAYVILHHTQLREPGSFFEKLSCNTGYHTSMVCDPFFCLSWVVSCCTTPISQPYRQSYRITQSPLPFSPTIPSYLSHSTNWGCIKDLSAALVLIYFSFRETLAGITALTITD